MLRRYGFNTQPPEGGWKYNNENKGIPISFNTQPPEGGWSFLSCSEGLYPCFNTQPPEGGWNCPHLLSGIHKRFQHTAARRRLAVRGFPVLDLLLFQHTAARRRLAVVPFLTLQGCLFQHTAARRRLVVRCVCRQIFRRSFNTQPPEGGWSYLLPPAGGRRSFNTQPPEGGWAVKHKAAAHQVVSTHSRPKAAG